MAKIELDEQDINFIAYLCDMAMKAEGLKANVAVNRLLGKLALEKKEEKEEISEVV